jgi:hypothetical protein
MFELKNKIIYILTPQKWGPIHISKHHYAIELSKSNTVYFINPPDYALSERLIIEKINNNLLLIHYKPFIPYFLRFKIRWLFEILILFQIKWLKKKIKEKPDIVWSFDNLTFINLKKFKSKLSIYHLVDSITYDFQLKPAKNADIMFAVSNTILKEFATYSLPKYFINHGISEEVEKVAIDNIRKLDIIDANKLQNNKINVGYVGNLLIDIIQHNIIKQIISENPDVIFNFWGPNCPDKSNLGGKLTKNIQDFISFLEKSPNVILHGIKKTSDLIYEINKMDVFILFYNYKKGVYDRSNSHKILEYLATGKVIISNRISTYNNFDNLIQMPINNEDSLLPDMFISVLRNLNYYNSVSLQKERIKLALENTYPKQIGRIQHHINQNHFKFDI